MSDDRQSGISRRELLRRAAAGAVAVGLGSLAVEETTAGERKASASGSPRAKVILVRDGAAIDVNGRVNAAVVESMLDRAMLALTGKANRAAAWRQFAEPADRVGIKSNLMMTPTHPELLHAICQGLKAAGVHDDRILIWDRDQGGRGESEIQSLTRRLGYGKDDVSNGVWESTVLINAPGLKSHWLAGMAGALKNWAGAVTHINTADDGVSYAFHADSCRETGMLNAIPAIRQRCRLTIVDALRPLCHGGPQVDPRYLWDYGGLLLGTDPVAVDTIGLEIIQGRRRQVRGGEWPLRPPVKHIAVAASKYGLGISDRQRIDLAKIGLSKDSFV